MIAQNFQVPCSDKIVLHASVEGPEGAPWLVFSNSVLTNLSVWDAQASVLKQSYRVLRYDQRGHGESTVFPAPMTFQSYGADLVTLMQAVGIQSACFVGLSMGVPTGLAAFAQHPTLFSRMVFVDGITRSAPGREEFWRNRRELAQDQGMRTLAQQTARTWLPGEANDAPVVQSLERMISTTHVQGFSAASFALGQYDQSAVLSDLHFPTLCITGALDGTMPEAMRVQFDAIPGVRFQLIDGAGHLPNFQRPALFNAALIAFLKDTE